MVELNSSEKIRLLAKRRNMTLGEVAEKTEQTRQNLNAKLNRANFPENELLKIADVLGCDLEIKFIDRETKETF